MDCNCSLPSLSLSLSLFLSFMLNICFIAVPPIIITSFHHRLYCVHYHDPSIGIVPALPSQRINQLIETVRWMWTDGQLLRLDDQFQQRQFNQWNQWTAPVDLFRWLERGQLVQKRHWPTDLWPRIHGFDSIRSSWRAWKCPFPPLFIQTSELPEKFENSKIGSRLEDDWMMTGRFEAQQIVANKDILLL